MPTAELSLKKACAHWMLRLVVLSTVWLSVANVMRNCIAASGGTVGLKLLKGLFDTQSSTLLHSFFSATKKQRGERQERDRNRR